MEKEIKEFEVLYSFDWEFGVKLTKLKKDIEEIEKLGVTHIRIEAEQCMGFFYIKIEAFCERLETDAEFEMRKKLVEAEKNLKKSMDLRKLAYLKSLYENDKD